MAKASKKAPAKSRGGKPAPVSTKPAVPAAADVRDPFVALRREIDHLFDDFLGRFRWPSFGRSLFEYEPFAEFEPLFGRTAPSVDMSETDKEYQIVAEMPGLDENDVEVVLSGDLLTIKGEKKQEKVEKRKDTYRSERRYGSLSRSFRLPDAIDQDKVAAEIKNGILTVTLPKTPEARKKVKKIGVKAR